MKDDKEEFDACMAQAEFAFKCYDTRRQYEFKLTLGFWTFIALGIGFLREWSIDTAFTIVVVVGAAALMVLHAVWLSGILRGSSYDKDRAMTFRREAAQIANLTHCLPEWQPTKSKIWDGAARHLHLPFLADWALRFQFLTTVILLVIAVFTITKHPQEHNGPMEVARSAAETGKMAAQTATALSTDMQRALVQLTKTDSSCEQATEALKAAASKNTSSPSARQIIKR